LSEFINTSPSEKLIDEFDYINPESLKNYSVSQSERKSSSVSHQTLSDFSEDEVKQTKPKHYSPWPVSSTLVKTCKL